MALAEGTRVFLRYDLPGPELYHERYILCSCACGRGWHIILTPDNDVYPELISLDNDDLASYRVGTGLQLPVGLNDGNTYRIRALPDEATMNQLRRDAAHAAAALALPPGAGAIAAPVGAAPALAVPVVGAAADSEVWVRVESEEGHARGERVMLDGSEIIHGNIGLKSGGSSFFAIRRMPESQVDKYKGAEAASDARLMSVGFQGLQREERQWRDVSKEINEEKFDDWGLPGPRTSSWCIRFLNRRNGGPSDHHRWWVSNLGLKPDGWGVAEHDTLMKVVDRLGRFDGLDISNLMGAEVAFRRLQLIEYVYSDRGPGGGKGYPKGGDKSTKDVGLPSYEAAIFSGSHKEFSDTMVAPSLLEHVSKEVEVEASVMKQMRKAREERAAANK